MSRVNVKMGLVVISILLGLLVFRLYDPAKCQVAPCVFADEYGEAWFLLQEGIYWGNNGFSVDVTQSGTEIRFMYGFELSELAVIETVDWREFTYLHNGQHVLTCVGTHTLSREQIERFREWDGAVYSLVDTDPMAICDAAVALLEG